MSRALMEGEEVTAPSREDLGSSPPELSYTPSAVDAATETTQDPLSLGEGEARCGLGASRPSRDCTSGAGGGLYVLVSGLALGPRLVLAAWLREGSGQAARAKCKTSPPGEQWTWAVSWWRYGAGCTGGKPCGPGHPSHWSGVLGMVGRAGQGRALSDPQGTSADGCLWAETGQGNIVKTIVLSGPQARHPLANEGHLLAVPRHGRRARGCPVAWQEGAWLSHGMAGGHVAVAWQGQLQAPLCVRGSHDVCVSAPVLCELQGEGGDPRAERSRAAPLFCPLLPNPRSRVWSGGFPAGGQGLLLGVFCSLSPGAPGPDPQMCGR